MVRILDVFHGSKTPEPRIFLFGVAAAATQDRMIIE